MKERLLIPKSELTFKDLVRGDYFKIVEENTLVNIDRVCRIVENDYNTKNILIGNSVYDIKKQYEDLEVIKLKPTKFENDTLYFEEI